MRRLALAGALLLVLVLAVAGAGALWALMELRASLPQLEGTRALPGLRHPVRVERDASGVPTLRGADRVDLARATGFLHAQERFFQMDLQRRRAAGELAELFGAAALPADREVRVHRLRARARAGVAQLPEADRRLLAAYGEGVNAGLAALDAAPFEYALLGASPAPWRSEDSALTVGAMYLVLQDAAGSRESMVGVMHDVLPAPLVAFLTPPGTRWDAPIEGGALATPAVPGPDVLDLRRRPPPRARAPARVREPRAPGSNNWAVAGALTAHGGALVADDMHLSLSVPNIWYRVSLVYPAADGERRVTGVTLPGTPAVVVGSNGRVAWGFTNSMGDWHDLVVLEPVPEEPDAYRTPGGPRRFERHEEVVRVRDGDDARLEVLETIWGPVIDRDHRGRRRALRWVAHDPRAGNVELLRLEDARDVREALAVAQRAGAPAQNFVAGDRDGRIGWTILGAIPRRFGHDGRRPRSWADGSRGWDGWLAPEAYPSVVDPPTHRVWSANNRVVGGETLARIGNDAMLTGARAQQIRDALLAAERFDERDMLAIQLDHRALFLARWRDLLLEVLDARALEEDPRRRALRAHVEAWGARAEPASVGYRAVREFRLASAQRAFGALTAPCFAADPRFRYEASGQQLEGPLWRLVSERPPHLLDPRHASWEALLRDAADEVLANARAAGRALDDYTWGAHNRAEIRHPMSPFLPSALSRWLDMPPDPLAGDTYMPLQQTRAFAVSQRMVVSPGREVEGIFHMPAGQSAHPLSPYFGAGHEAWLRGVATPFLPGPTRHVLELEPAPPAS